MITNGEWSASKAVRIEELLIPIVASIAGVTNVIGRSYKGREDYKIHFNHGYGSDLVSGCFLEFIPDDPSGFYTVPCLHGWTGALSAKYPVAVLDGITKLFPHAYMDSRPGVGNDPLHYWVGVFEVDLQAVADSINTVT